MDAEKKTNIKNGILALLAVAAAAFLCVVLLKTGMKAPEIEETLDPNETTVYTASVSSSSPYGGNLIVYVSLNAEGTIVDIEIGENNATEGVGTKAIDALPSAIIEAQSTDVDYVAGASITSEAFINAVNDALSQAEGAAQ